ncbi:MAG TPA: hypothetical protein VFT27_00885, partial [Actinomycetota bacterium]|nr:hypothetical protein [Actinomycetota bacterium]
VDILQRIADLEMHPERRSRYLYTMAQLYRDKLGDQVRAVELFNEALALAEEVDDVATVARVMGAMARPFVVLDRVREHHDRMRQTLDRVGSRLDEPTRVRLILAVVTSSIHLGRSEESLPLIDEALAIIERDRLDDVLADAIGQKSWALSNVGRHREAAILMHGALELSEEHGSMEFRAEALMAMGIVEMEDDPRASLRYSLEAADAARRAGVRGLEILGMANAAEAAVDTGDWGTADGLLEDLLGRPELSGLTRLGSLMGVALLAAHRGEHQSARSTLEETKMTGLETDMTAARTWFHRTRATVLLLGGELEQAFEAGMDAIREDPAGMNTPMSSWSSARAALWLKDPERVRSALGAMDPLRGRWIDVARRTVEAGLAALEGRLDDAAAAYADCLDAWTALDLPLDRAMTVVDAALLLPSELRPLDENERTIEYLRGLGARALLDRLESVEAAGPLTPSTGSPTTAA